MSTNTKWFKEKLAERDMSMRRLAKHLGLDPAAVSLTLRGMRKMTSPEAHQIGQLLGVQVTEVLRQAGVPISDDVRTVPWAQYVTSKGQVKELAAPGKRQVGPPDLPADGFALQVRSPASVYDKWMVFCSGAKLAAEGAVGRLSVVKCGEELYLGTLQEGYDAGTYNIVLTVPSPGALENKKITWACPVLWIRPT